MISPRSDAAFVKLIKKTKHYFVDLRDRRYSESNLVYGHYSFDYFANPRKDGEWKGSFFREPKDQLVSLYLYHCRKYRHEKMSFANFFYENRLYNLWQRYLGGQDVERLAFIGLQEDYSGSIKLLKSQLGIELREHFSNVAPTSAELGDGYRESFGYFDASMERLMAPTYEMWDRVTAEYARRCAHGGR